MIFLFAPMGPPTPAPQGKRHRWLSVETNKISKEGRKIEHKFSKFKVIIITIAFVTAILADKSGTQNQNCPGLKAGKIAWTLLTYPFFTMYIPGTMATAIVKLILVESQVNLLFATSVSRWFSTKIYWLFKHSCCTLKK